MDVTELLIKGIVVGLFQENCWVVGSRRTGEGLVIDPGDEPDRIMEVARDLGVHVRYIVNTHAHLDHIMAVPPVQRGTGARFLPHPDDPTIAPPAGARAARLLGRAGEPPPAPAPPLGGGAGGGGGGPRLQVIHTPGHTPGSVCLYTDGLLFSGDTLFFGSVGRTDLPGGNHAQLMNSIIDKLLALPDDTIVLPGHMLETRIGHERQTNPFILDALQRRAR